ncbi:MAG: class B sortase [Clostridiales bacterium]|nr:class B sortase [Clostridiales bacterium]
MKKRKVFLFLAFIAFFAVAVFSMTQIVLSLQEYGASDKTYEELRQIYEPPEPDIPAIAAPVEETDDPPPEEVEEIPVKAPPRPPAEVNPDYIGWLKITSTTVSYPLVKGADNDYYLHTAFDGSKNKLGAIFMDCRCAEDFSGYHTIVYGHNARNGTMFGSLYKYQDANYLDKHREIIITLPDSTKQAWRIFAARKSDIHDIAYRLNFSGPESFALFAESLNAPDGTSKILTLSTCTSGGTKDERMLIHAVPVE